MTRRAKRHGVIGVGGAGINTVNNLIQAGLKRKADCIAVSFKADDLRRSKALAKIMFPSGNRNPAQGQIKKLQRFVKDISQCYIVAGFGGVSTGIVMKVSKIVQDVGIRPIGYFYTPFKYEGKWRRARARRGVAMMGKHLDRFTVVPNERLFSQCDDETTAEAAFLMLESGLRELIKAAELQNPTYSIPSKRLNNDKYIHLRLARVSKQDKNIVRGVLCYLYLFQGKLNIKRSEIRRAAKHLEPAEKILVAWLQTRSNSWLRSTYGHRAVLAAKKAGFKCQKCGWDDVRVLQLDHLSGKKRRKFQCLCANCHQIKSRKYDWRNNHKSKR